MDVWLESSWRVSGYKLKAMLAVSPHLYLAMLGASPQMWNTNFWVTWIM